MDARPKVALVGAGAMGGALLSGWIDKGAIDGARSAVFEPAPSAAVEALCGVSGLALNPPRAARFDALVLAIKPQGLEAAAAYRAMATEALVVSVLAGKSLAAISSVLGTTRIVRAMPNLPAMIGAGVSGLYAPANLSEADRRLAAHLMQAVGETVFVDSEAAIDVVTAISGSGPAYFFLLAEALEEAARDLGLGEEAARLLARATLIGAGRVLEKDERETAGLRRAVTSPGGTTEAALKVLDGEGDTVRVLMKKAAAAAFARAQALSS